jgi:hypothetical protein
VWLGGRGHQHRVAKSDPLFILMGKKWEKVPKENMRASSEKFSRERMLPRPSIDTNGQEVSKMFQKKFFHASMKKLEATGHRSVMNSAVTT